MRTRPLITTALSLAIMTAFLPSGLRAEEKAAHHAHADPAMAAAVGHSNRTEANRARDRYRHPVETLSFFGVKPSDTVVEIWPGRGWYSEILGPLTQEKGTLYLATAARGLDQTKGLAAGNTALAHARVAIFPNADGQMKVPDGTADMVLTFRNVHNWRFGGADSTQAAFNQIYAMLKPGGILAIEQHRANPGEQDPKAASGYVTEAYVIEQAQKAGFELADRSEINANAKDTKDHPEGVWTLPPTLELGDKDREKYMAIGESDRMTLKFVKPQ